MSNKEPPHRAATTDADHHGNPDSKYASIRPPFRERGSKRSEHSNWQVSGRVNVDNSGSDQPRATAPMVHGGVFADRRGELAARGDGDGGSPASRHASEPAASLAATGAPSQLPRGKFPAGGRGSREEIIARDRGIDQDRDRARCLVPAFGGADRG